MSCRLPQTSSLLPTRRRRRNPCLLGDARATNARAEGLNAVKRINAAGGGSTPFDLLRARVIHGRPQRHARAAHQSDLKVRLKARRKVPPG